MTYKMKSLTDKWMRLGFAYVFHDDSDMLTRLGRLRPEFPHMKMALTCIVSMTTMADLWKYVVLWDQGGVFADLDTTPHSFDNRTITHDDDAYFVVEHYGLLSQYFMAASPRHPLMFLAIQNALQRILSATDVGGVPSHSLTGPWTLHAAFRNFLGHTQHGNDVIPLRKGHGAGGVLAGRYQNSANRSVTVQGERGERSDDIIYRESIDHSSKVTEYATMGMKHYRHTKATKKNCIQTLYEEQTKTDMLEKADVQ